VFSKIQVLAMSDSDVASNYYRAACHLMQIGDGYVWAMECALRAFEKAAGLGHTYAKVLLAGLLSSKQESKTRAEQIAREVRSKVQECADRGDSEAQWCLGRLCWKKEKEKAISWFKKSADLGNIYAQFDLGHWYFGEGCTDLAAKEWTKAADQGHIDAQFHLSNLYLYGDDGVTEDISKSFQLCKKAALQHHFFAQIAILCHHEQCEETCIQILNLGNKQLQFEVADTLFKSEKFDLAVKWYTRAAEEGHAEAQFHLGRFFYNGTGVTQSYEKAVYWYSKVADQGLAIAQYNLGCCFEHGEGVDKDIGKAIDLYTDSALQGFPDAQFNLGRFFYNGTGVPEDALKAVEWYTKAAEQGHAEAQFNLGTKFDYGQGVERSIDQAVEWYTKAAEQGTEKAQLRLAQLEMRLRNRNKAIHWLSKAANQGSEEARRRLRNLTGSNSILLLH
jgi:TPR repeat protein